MDIYYIVFCRLVGVAGKPLKSMPADALAAAVEVLEDLVSAVTSDSSVTKLTSPYGRILVVPHSAPNALKVAISLLQQAAAQGLRVSLGIASGPVDEVRDSAGYNLTGAAINRAARLASLKESLCHETDTKETGANLGEGRIAIQESVIDHVLGSTSDYPETSFSTRLDGKAKRSELSFRWLELECPPLGPGPRSAKHHQAVTRHILVYDVVGYSDLHHDQLPKVVEDLRRQVDAACRAHGMDPRDVIPTGDGGVLVGETGPQTWRFATSLFQRCKRAGIKIRIGVALGPIVLLKDPSSGGDVPVGAGILEADRLSELAVVDAICVHREIWETYLMKSDRQEWASQNLEDEQKALLVKQLRPSGDGTAPAPDTNQASSVKPASTPRLPKIPPGSFESDREALDFADSLFLELKRRCGELEENGLQATLEGGGANSYYRLDLSYRHVHVYSFYMNVTWGIEGNPPPDISLSAYPGPCTGSAPEFKNLERGWCNASGPFLWDTEKNMPAWEIDLTNDLLREGSYSYEDLLEALWHLICEALELSVKLCGRF